MRKLSCCDVTLEFSETGPRITGLRIEGGENLFAELPGVVIERPDDRPFHLLGGHRLWIAPEIPEVTYTPDDEPVAFTDGERSLRARGAVDSLGVIKEIDATVTHAGAVVVDHRIVNAGSAPIEAAPWAITQFPPEGAAVLPITAQTADAVGLQANRSIILWPYTDLGAPGLRLSRDAVVVEGSDRLRQKIGVENRSGWVAYHRGGVLFAKWALRHDASQSYVDRGASIQVYRDEHSIELESLGPVRTIDPGEAIGHREIWQVFETGPVPRHEVADLATSLLSEKAAVL